MSVTSLDLIKHVRQRGAGSTSTLQGFLTGSTELVVLERDPNKRGRLFKEATFITTNTQICRDYNTYHTDRHVSSQNLLFWTSCTDLLVVLLLGLEAVVRGLEPQVDMREIVQPVSPPGRNVIHPSRRHPCPEPKKFRLQPKLASPDLQPEPRQLGGSFNPDEHQTKDGDRSIARPWKHFSAAHERTEPSRELKSGGGRNQRRGAKWTGQIFCS